MEIYIGALVSIQSVAVVRWLAIEPNHITPHQQRPVPSGMDRVSPIFEGQYIITMYSMRWISRDRIVIVFIADAQE